MAKVKFRFRHELKYVVDINKCNAFFEDLKEYCDFDKHADKTNSYEISSLYYDTETLRFYRDREESVGNRRKVRLRTYVSNEESSGLFIEIKERHQQFVNKKRIHLDKDNNILDYPNHSQIPLNLVVDKLPDTAEGREMYYLNKRLELSPVVIVKYIRKALIPKFENDMRITLDTRITAGASNLLKFNQNEEKYILDGHLGVLEFKSAQSMPLWLHGILNKYDFKRTRFSKYCLSVDKCYYSKKPFMTNNL